MMVKYNQALNLLYYAVLIKSESQEIITSVWDYQLELFQRFFEIGVNQNTPPLKGMEHNAFIKKYWGEHKFSGVPDNGINIILFNCMIANYQQSSLFNLMGFMEQTFKSLINVNIGLIDDNTPQHKHIHEVIKRTAKKLSENDQFIQYYKLKIIH